jgi:hypothetical protein
MMNLHRATGMLAITLGLVLLPSLAKTSNAQEGTAAPAATSGRSDRFDLGVNYTYKFAQIADPATTRFMLPGISLDAAYTLGKKHNGLALAAEINAELANKIVPGVNLQQVSIVGGPRYTVHLAKFSNHPVDVYGQAFAGYLFASDSVFPGPLAASSSATSGVFQTGGGVNLHLSKSISVRLVEADYVITNLPNNANNKQYDLRLSNGVVFHF